MSSLCRNGVIATKDKVGGIRGEEDREGGIFWVKGEVPKGEFPINQKKESQKQAQQTAKQGNNFRGERPQTGASSTLGTSSTL